MLPKQSALFVIVIHNCFRTALSLKVNRIHKCGCSLTSNSMRYFWKRKSPKEQSQDQLANPSTISIYLFIRLFSNLSIRLSTFIYPTIHLSNYLSFYLSLSHINFILLVASLLVTITFRYHLIFNFIISRIITYHFFHGRCS